MSVRARIDHHLRRRGLTRAELARRSGVSKGHITTIFAGSANLTLETLERLAYALEVSPVELMGDFPALLEFARAEGLPVDEYLKLKEEVPDDEKPSTVEGWRALYRRRKAGEYAGLAEYLDRAGLTFTDVVPLLRSLARRNLPPPNSAEAWEQQHRWFRAFPE